MMMMRRYLDSDIEQAMRLAGALHVLENLPPAEATAVADFTLASLGAGFPQMRLFEDVRATAELWADSASHLEMEAYTVEGLRRLGSVPLALGQRKRLFRALWDGFSDRDRSAFLASVRRAS
jgi:hypothetical protein